MNDRKIFVITTKSQTINTSSDSYKRISEKHPDVEIEPVNKIQPPEIKYIQTPQALVLIDTPLSIIHKHISTQSDTDKIVKNIKTCVIHSLELPI